jgi:uncharacterized protein YndB with AHSA1/START domain
VAKRNDSKDIRITRVYDASLKAVWDAWTDPEQVAKWWGPRGFTLTTHSKDLRPGGTWDYTMHGPDGTDWPNLTKYHEVEPYALLVYDHGGSKDRPPLFRVTARFTELGPRKTELDMTMSLDTVEAARETRAFIKKASGESTWDRLDEYLAKEGAGEERFVINRSFDAPIAKMWKLWTDPEHFARWLPPTGATMKFIEVDIREGGKSRYAMTTDAGTTMYGRVHYKELVAPTRLVYTQEFCDEKGNIARHPAAPTWPEVMLTTVTLTEEGPDTTRVTVKWTPVGEVTPEEVATFVQARAGMTGGWTGSFDKLEALIEGGG